MWLQIAEIKPSRVYGKEGEASVAGVVSLTPFLCNSYIVLKILCLVLCSWNTTQTSVVLLLVWLLFSAVPNENSPAHQHYPLFPKQCHGLVFPKSLLFLCCFTNRAQISPWHQLGSQHRHQKGAVPKDRTPNWSQQPASPGLTISGLHFFRKADAAEDLWSSAGFPLNIFSPLLCDLKSYSVPYQEFIRVYSFYSGNFARDASAPAALKKTLMFDGLLWQLTGLQSEQPYTSLCLPAAGDGPAKHNNLLKSQVLSPKLPRSAGKCSLAPPREPVLPDLLVIRNGAELKDWMFTKQKQNFGANSVLHNPAWSSPGAGARYRMWSFCHLGRRRSKMGCRFLEPEKGRALSPLISIKRSEVFLLLLTLNLLWIWSKWQHSK